MNNFIFSVVFSALFLLIVCQGHSQEKSHDIIDRIEGKYQGVTNIEVRGGFCRVEIIGGNTSEVTFVGELSGNADKEEQYKIKEEKIGSTLKVWLERPKVTTWSNMNGKLIFNAPKNIEIFVDNNSGSVYVENNEANKIHLEANSGGVSASSIKATTAYFKANSGSLKITSVKAEITAKTNSGGQKFTDIVGNITTEANSGSIKYETVKGNIVAETSSGGQQLVNVEGKLSLKASSGSLRGENILITDNSTFKTSSGGIKMDFKNNLKELSFDLEANSGGLTVGNERGAKRYIVKTGQILVTGISSSGSQRYDGHL